MIIVFAFFFSATFSRNTTEFRARKYFTSHRTIKLFVAVKGNFRYKEIPGPRTQELDAELRTLGPELWTLDSRRSNLYHGRWTLEAGYWTLYARLWTLKL